MVITDVLKMKIVDDEFEIFLETIKKNNINKINIENIKKAYYFSRESHINQKRQTGDPYITHPLEVAKIVFDYGLDEASIIASFLHDVVEDTSVSLDEIRKNFGEEVETLVDGLSKINLFTETREEKSIEALRKILLASAKDIRVLIIKLCDRLHNLRTLEELPEGKRERVARETMLIYAPIAQKIGIYSLKWELEDLSFKYRNPEMFQLIKSKINMKRKDREEIVKKAVDEIKDVLKAHGIKNAIALGRPKNFYSIYKKVKDKAKSFEDLYDLYAIRIICKSISECYTILGILHEDFQAFPDKLKDYIANPKANGYQSIHTIIFSRSINCPVEVQLRTEEMHKLAEFGVAAHWKYKNLKEDKKFEKKIGWLREVLQWEKEHKDNIEFLNLLKYDFFQNEIFVFTPKNDIIFLPEGSSILDFAYAVHTEIGSKASRAKVNGVMTTIEKTLKNGDIVEIITNASVKPNEKWLKMVKTSKAKLKIRDQINLKYINGPGDDEVHVSFESLIKRLTRVSEFKKVRKAGCCNLQFGDHVVGVLAKDKELVIHNASCENAKYTLNKKIPLNWIEERKKEIEINMILKDRFGLLIDILNVFSEFNLNVSKLNTNIFKDGTVKMGIKIADGPYMDKLLERLKELDSVESVNISRGFFFL